MDGLFAGTLTGAVVVLIVALIWHKRFMDAHTKEMKAHRDWADAYLDRFQNLK